MAREPGRVRRRDKKNISSGVAHINASFNNTMITITDAQGNAISWSSAGMMGFKAAASRLPMPRRSPPTTRAARPPSTACAPWKSK